MVVTCGGLVGFMFGLGQEHCMGGSVFFHQAAGTHCPGPLSFGLALPALGKGSTPQLWVGGW